MEVVYHDPRLMKEQAAGTAGVTGSVAQVNTPNANQRTIPDAIASGYANTVSRSGATYSGASPKFISTRRSATELDICRIGILETMKKKANLTIEGGLVDTDVFNASAAGTSAQLIENPCPVVILVSGVGGGGKDTFIEFVGKHCAACNLSSITECKDVTVFLEKYTKDMADEMGVDPTEHREAKTDDYRNFLHDIKTAWAKFCDGPTWSLASQLNNILQNQYTGGSRCDVVFMHIREGAEIDKAKRLFEKRFGVIVLTMCVKGLVAQNAIDCPADYESDQYQYDLVIQNTPDQLAIFELQATMFASKLMLANSIYGVPCVNGITSTTVVNTGTASDKATYSTPTDSNSYDTLVGSYDTSSDVAKPNGKLVTDKSSEGTFHSYDPRLIRT